MPSCSIVLFTPAPLDGKRHWVPLVSLYSYNLTEIDSSRPIHRLLSGMLISCPTAAGVAASITAGCYSPRRNPCGLIFLGRPCREPMCPLVIT
jgi:hypothetical protein